jgi:hypothetical protein
VLRLATGKLKEEIEDIEKELNESVDTTKTVSRES